jgi:hypothetical protein
MTSIISAISGQFSKALVLGTFLPVVVFVILSMVFVLPLFPESWSLLRPLQELGTEWKIIAISFYAIVLSGLLYNLNIPIIRLYEGYPWQKSRLGASRANHYKSKLNEANSRWLGMTTLLRAMDPADPAWPIIRQQREEYIQTLNSKFPKDPNLVLPTALGNVIRSFEDYPYRQYGMESITLWPRLIAKIDQNYAVAIDDAKASFDFMLNSSALSALLALTILIAGLIYPVRLASWYLWRSWLPWIIQVIVFSAVSYWFYVMSIGRAAGWGDLVKSAFDLFRWDLLKQLGFKRVPLTMAEERAVWNDIYQQLLYGDTPSTPLADYRSMSSFAMPSAHEGVPNFVYLRVARGVSPPATDGRVTVTLSVKNVDPRRQDAEDIIVTDTLAEGFDYQWSSVRLLNYPRRVEVEGTNPMRFRVGNLKFDEKLILLYDVISRKK